MPELPEVEVVKRALEEIFKENPVVQEIKWNRKDLRFPLPLKEFRLWKKARIIAIHRRAKYLLIESSIGSLVCHLGMTGSFRIRSKDDERTHDHVEFLLGRNKVLVFEDPRRFGFFLRWPGSWEKVTREPLGPEPFSDTWTAEYLKEAARGKKAPVKNFLMDQKVIVGIGNIYASEILFQTRIRPQRPANRVSLVECRKIVQISREVLQNAISQGGSSIRDFSSPIGGEGGFQNAHLVYDREGESCVICSTPIKRKVMAGRSTFWCPSCQT